MQYCSRTQYHHHLLTPAEKDEAVFRFLESEWWSILIWHQHDQTRCCHEKAKSDGGYTFISDAYNNKNSLTIISITGTVEYLSHWLSITLISMVTEIDSDRTACLSQLDKLAGRMIGTWGFSARRR